MGQVNDMIEQMKQYPSCAHLSPPYIATILESVAAMRVVRLGIFNSTVEGEAAAARIEICSDDTIAVIMYAVNHGSYMETIVIFQMVHLNMCSQMYVKAGFSTQRGIFFTDDSRKRIREIGNWG